MLTADSVSVTTLMFTLPWKRRTNPGNYTPHCYGAFEGDGVDLLIFELCECAGRAKCFRAVSSGSRIEVIIRRYSVSQNQSFHSIGIVHEDLEPRNVVHARGGGLRLIDFSESTKHTCKESEVQ